MAGLFKKSKTANTEESHSTTVDNHTTTTTTTTTNMEKAEGEYRSDSNGDRLSDENLKSGQHLDAEKGGQLETGESVPWTAKRIIAIAALCTVYVGSQVLLYFVSAGLSAISVSLGTRIGNWMITANTLAVAAICPFVGYMTDLLGRRWVCVGGTVLLIIGSAIMATSHELGQAVAAQAIGGIGAGICELTALAGVAEISPQRWRGVTLSIVTFSIVPFMPQVLYTIEIIEHSTWRYCFLLTGLWNFIGLVGLVFCYHPPPRHNVDNLTTKHILARIDYLGAFLSIAGVTLFLVGLQAGGYQYAWVSGKVLGPLIVGALLIIAFFFWEIYGPHQYPMMPKEIFQGQRVVALAYVIVFVAGMDFYSILGFFPITLEDVYNTSAITTGVRALCYPWAILGGACIVSALMSYTRGHVRVLFTVSAAIMTAFTAALAKSTPNNAPYTIAMATLAAFGNGALVVPALTLALYAAPDNYIGTVGALSLSSRFLGGSVGTSVYFNVFNQKITKNLPLLVGQAAIANNVPSDSVVPLMKAMAAAAGYKQLGEAVPGVTQAALDAAIYARQWSFAIALKYVWYTTIPFGVISTLCCLALPNIKQYMTNRVAVDIH